MKYKLGDFVRFVDEKMEGFVTRIIDEQMVGVTGEDDFEIPVPAAKVTFVHGYEAAGQHKNEITAELTVKTGEFVTNGVFIGVANDEKAKSVVHFYLINQTSFQLLVTLTTQKQLVFKGEYAGILKPASTAKIYSAQLADMQLWPKLTINILFFTAQNVLQPGPLTFSEKFKAKDFAGAKKQLPLVNQPGWLFPLDEPPLLVNAEQLKESFFKPAAERALNGKPLQEVDLHIEKLRDDHLFLNGAEILRIQIDHFNKTLDAAIVHQLPDITFIHGTGNGILKHELHKLLSRNNKIQTFMDARKEKFGYGATKVLLK